MKADNKPNNDIHMKVEILQGPTMHVATGKIPERQADYRHLGAQIKDVGECLLYECGCEFLRKLVKDGRS